MDVRGMAGHLIRRLNQNSTQLFTKRIQQIGFDLTPVQFAAMSAIAGSPGIDQVGVAKRIAYDRATIGGVIDRLEHKGFITRSVSKRDRRARELKISDKGREVYDEILPVVQALQNDMLPGLSQDERDRFLELAGKAVASVDA